MVIYRSAKIALTALQVANEMEEFRLPELKDQLQCLDSPPSNSTIRQVLRQLEADDWLEREHPEGRIWYAGEQLAAFTE